MRKSLLLVSIVALMASQLRADEGMWVLPALKQSNFDQMRQLGFQLPDSAIYNLSRTGLKDAVVIFGNGCTGEIVSEQGLIFTNHHCGYDAIQDLSSLKDNYLQDGFWAKSIDNELPASNLTVTFLRSMEDVTNDILSVLSDTLSSDDQYKTISLKIEELKKESIKGEGILVDIKPFFGGNKYYKMVYEKYSDVRLVGTPPSSIGKFGFDTDNWMWPRHTGDFSIFRVYGSPEGKPAAYSKENTPLLTKNYLPISVKGVEKEDFTMTIGFPGSTNRYLTSWGIKQQVEIENNLRILVRGVKQDIWMADMVADPKINLQYASKFSRSSNYWKNSIGMNRGVKKLNVIATKESLEDSLAAWINSSEDQKAKYGNVLSNLKSAYSQYEQFSKNRILTTECLINGIEIYKIAYSAKDIISILEKDSNADISKELSALKVKLQKIYKDYSPSTDKKVLAALLKTYRNNMTDTEIPLFIKNLSDDKSYKNYASKLFNKSIFADEKRMMAFLDNPKSNLFDLKKDPAYNDGAQIYAYSKNNTKNSNPTFSVIDDNNKLFIAALMEMHPNKNYYPDANFTMRLSYGKIGDYEPQDGVIYKHFTTLKGVIEKEVPDSYEFSVPAKLKELYNSKDYGVFADSNGEIRVCFTSNNDITGGNSGSPVLNKNGELIGLAFDGNWEAMSGDIAFETKLQKTISIDIRYLLFIIDKYAGATNLIEELKIVK